MSHKCYVIVIGIMVAFNTMSHVVGYGLIQNVKEGSCLATTGSGQVEAEKTHLVPCDITDGAQQWHVMAMIDYESSSGWVRARSGRCLDGNPSPVSGSPYADSSNYVYSCAAVPGHYWKLINGDFDGTFQLQNVYQNKCLTPVNGGASLQNNADCYSGSTLQYWRVIPSAADQASVCKLGSPF